VRDHRGEQRPVQIGATWLIAAERLEGTGEAAPFVNVLQQIFNSYTRKAGTDRGAQLAHRTRDSQGVALLEFESAVDDGGEAVAGRPRSAARAARSNSAVILAMKICPSIGRSSRW
jgi:hypothetical protein